MKTLLVVLGLGAGGAAAYYFIRQNTKKKLIDALYVDLSDVEKQGTGLATLQNKTIGELKEYQSAVKAKKQQLIAKITSTISSTASDTKLLSALPTMTAQELVDIDTYYTLGYQGLGPDESLITRLEIILAKYALKGS
jgi:hypothetical protein